MPNYNIYITRDRLMVKRDRELHPPVNNFLNEALVNVTASTKEKALVLAKKIIYQKQNKVFVPEYEVKAFTAPVAKKDQSSIIEEQEIKVEAS